MDIVFRLDVSLDIGQGHLIRCLNLANEMRKRGKRCLFIINGITEYIINLIESNGHQCSELNAIQNEGGDNEKFNYLNDVNATIELIIKSEPEWMVVDHYNIDALWHKEIRPYVKNIMVIDDLANRDYECDILLDASYGRSVEDYSALAKGRCKFIF